MTSAHGATSSRWLLKRYGKSFWTMLTTAVLVLLSVSNAVTDENKPPTPALPIDTLPIETKLDVIPDGLDPQRVTPADNPLTIERVALGRRLFFDPVMSKDRLVSCASCHQPDHGFASPDRRAVGIRGQVGRRNAPTVLNRAFGESQFWDGRAATLEEQALQPIANPMELGHSVDGVVAELKNDPQYIELFSRAFAADTTDSQSVSANAEYVTAANVARSLASFQRTLLFGDSPVDRFQSGNYNALTTEERQGLWIFESRGRCWKCHSGNNYTDEAFHNTGVEYDKPKRDLGRFEVTKLTADKGKFKTPTLRAIGLTAPYMHDGSISSLKEVVEFYNIGGAANDPNLDSEMKSLSLSETEITQLVAFLQALSR